MHPLLTAALLAGLCTALLMPAWIALAKRHGIHDLPQQRRLHGSVTPRGAGVCIGLSLVAGLALSDGAEFAPPLALLSVLLLASIGVWDDLRSPSAVAKFVLQSLVALLLGFALRESWPLAWSAAVLVLAAGCLLYVNLWNFMDGINGLVAIQTVLIAAALALWPGQGAELALAAAWFAGAGLGFLPFNLPKASAFLGDSGSYLLGAAIFVLLALSVREGKFSLPQAFVLSSGILFDGGFTLLQRALRGSKLWRAHREHLYQYAVRRGRSHVFVSLMYAAWTTLAAALAWNMGRLPAMQQWMLLTAFLTASWFAHVSLKRYCLASARRRKVA